MNFFFNIKNIAAKSFIIQLVNNIFNKDISNSNLSSYNYWIIKKNKKNVDMFLLYPLHENCSLLQNKDTDPSYVRFHNSLDMY